MNFFMQPLLHSSWVKTSKITHTALLIQATLLTYLLYIFPCSSYYIYFHTHYTTYAYCICSDGPKICHATCQTSWDIRRCWTNLLPIDDVTIIEVLWCASFHNHTHWCRGARVQWFVIAWGTMGDCEGFHSLWQGDILFLISLASVAS